MLEILANETGGKTFLSDSTEEQLEKGFMDVLTSYTNNDLTRDRVMVKANFLYTVDHNQLL